MNKLISDSALVVAEQALVAGDYPQAQRLAAEIVARQPTSAAWAVQGLAWYHQGQLSEAMACFDQAQPLPLSLAVCQAYLHGLRQTCRLPRAAEVLRAALEVFADDVGLLAHAINIYQDLGQPELAFAYAMRAVGRHPDDPGLHLLLGEVLLADGQFRAGWREYEWRNRMKNRKEVLMPKATSMPWSGMDIPGGAIVVIGDQGYGDCIQFFRLIPRIKAHCRHLYLAASQELLDLFAGMDGVDGMFSQWRQLPPHAAYVRVTSLPYIFDLDEPAIAKTAQPYLRPHAAAVARWQQQLGPAQGRQRPRRVGLNWRGRASHPRDSLRSLGLDLLLPLAAIEGIEFVCLQAPVNEADRRVLGAFEGMRDLTAECPDFSGKLGLISQLDLVISVDSSVAHLAAAAGVPTWILLTQSCDWRWLRDRDDSPWYASARLFRQREHGRWSDVIEAVARALRVQFAGGDAAHGPTPVVGTH
ncbi:tetratricopeptide repeat protein [Frateuria aurantia]